MLKEISGAAAVVLVMGAVTLGSATPASATVSCWSAVTSSDTAVAECTFSGADAYRYDGVRVKATCAFLGGALGRYTVYGAWSYGTSGRQSYVHCGGWPNLMVNGSSSYIIHGR